MQGDRLTGIVHTVNVDQDNEGFLLRIGLCSLFNYPWGGGETYVKQLSSFLTDSGYEVFHFSAFDKHPEIGGGASPSVFHVARKPLIEDLFYDFGILYYGLRLHRFALQKKIDVLHLHYIDFVPTSILLRNLDRVPVVVTLHWCPLDYPPELARELWHSKVFPTHQHLMFTLGIRNATKVISPSNYYADLVERKCGVRPIVIPNPIRLEDYECLPSREEARENLGLDAEDGIILYTGRLHPQKGLIYLIEAFQNIVQECPSAKLIIVGTGPSKDKLVDFARKARLKNISFTGYVEKHHLNQLLAAADVYVSPSVYETFGMAVLEALASGLPIVATNVGGLSEIVENGENGFLVPSRNPDALSDAVLKMLFSETMRSKFSRNNRIKAKKYSDDVIFPKILDIYYESMSSR